MTLQPYYLSSKIFSAIFQLDFFTIAEEDALPFAAGDAYIGILRFAGTVDYASHHRHFDRLPDFL